jgi:hypothetical protein
MNKKTGQNKFNKRSEQKSCSCGGVLTPEHESVCKVLRQLLSEPLSAAHPDGLRNQQKKNSCAIKLKR